MDSHVGGGVVKKIGSTMNRYFKKISINMNFIKFSCLANSLYSFCTVIYKSF